MDGTRTVNSRPRSHMEETIYKPEYFDNTNPNEKKRLEAIEGWLSHQKDNLDVEYAKGIWRREKELNSVSQSNSFFVTSENKLGVVRISMGYRPPHYPDRLGVATLLVYYPSKYQVKCQQIVRNTGDGLIPVHLAYFRVQDVPADDHVVWCKITNSNMEGGRAYELSIQKPPSPVDLKRKRD